jgi:hypothetical protein
LRKIRQSPPTRGEDRLIPFLASLVAEDVGPKTVDGYHPDLLAFLSPPVSSIPGN